ncbi:hypothetical protein SLS62_006709 [Diatrype stigma]|uniref:DUF5672 domain-containing protein n=1 Tax=Diatrype stigma TaxID=117547 RepID=A0AAN9UPA3_9PEZI
MANSLSRLTAHLPDSMRNGGTELRGVLTRLGALVLLLWSGTSRRMRLAGAFIALLTFVTYISLPTIGKVQVPVPRVSFEYQQHRPTAGSGIGGGDGGIGSSMYNASKVGLLIENRAFPFLAPLMLHFISVVPPDWRFRFMGSPESVASINASVAIRQQVAAGKLDLTYIPRNMSTASQELISRFLTNRWLYETVLQPAEWLLVFQTDSILCANSRQNLNDFLEYDWVGAPWNPSGRFGGNGGLSLRRVSAIVDILRDQVRADDSEPEDVWLTERLGHRPGAKMANGSLSLTFSGEMNQGRPEEVGKISGKPGSSGSKGGKKADAAAAAAAAVAEAEASHRLAGYNSTLEAAEAGEWVEELDDWREGFYEPMGYHTGGSGAYMHGGIWGTPEKRKHIWQYCPEVKMTLRMDAAKYVPGNCHPNWKRGEVMGELGELGDGEGEGFYGSGQVNAADLGYGTEIIDGVEYPILPPNLAPW